jgi:hypothetical protein
MWTREGAVPIPVLLVLALLARPEPAAGAPAAAPQPALPTTARIVLLHHSTGECVWNGGVPQWVARYNEAHGTRYTIAEQAFPKDAPYGWENYPYDYWNIWVRHAGPRPFKEEPTLEMLTPRHDVIVFKHCFPVSQIEADTGAADAASSDKRIENYQLQYAALKAKMRQFPKTRFLVWTGAALVQNETDAAAARRAKAFFEWVRTAWDEKGDNIYVWDFHTLETDGGLYLKAAYASGDSHPNEAFSRRVAPLLGRRIVDVIQGRGDSGPVTGGPAATTASAETAPPAPQPPQTPEPPAPPAETTAPAPQPPAPDPAVSPAKAAAGAWLVDNAEDPARRARLWPGAVTYVKDGGANVLRVDFAAGKEEDWGEYGKQRLVTTRPPAANTDVSSYRYLALRVKTDRAMEVPVTLLTLPEPRGSPHQSHFGFTAYLHPKAGAWQWMVVDLTKMELAAEGDAAYARAGKPTRPMQVTSLRLVTNRKHEKARVLIDNILFLRDLPPAMKRCVVQP